MKRRFVVLFLAFCIFYLSLVNFKISKHSKIVFTTSSECTITLSDKAFSIPLQVENNYYFSKQFRQYLKQNPDGLKAVELSTLVSEYVDIDNSISDSKKITRNLRITYLNAERGKFWCELAHLIKQDLILGNTDVWIMNEFDLGNRT